MNTPCKLCEKKRARRYCPGVHGEICATCCGTGREVTIDCPHECEYLQEARRHERPAPFVADELPNKDIRVSEEFVREHEAVVMWLTLAVARSMEKEKAVDLDAREALEALIKTYRTLESGLIYETRPQNPFAAGVQRALQESIEELRKHLAEESGMHTLRDGDVLGTLVFLQRLEIQHNNGRPRGRVFYDLLRTYFPAPEPSLLSVEP